MVIYGYKSIALGLLKNVLRKFIIDHMSVLVFDRSALHKISYGCRQTIMFYHECYNN